MQKKKDETVTKSFLEEKLAATSSQLEEKIAATSSQLEEKINEKFIVVVEKLDGIAKELKDMREEQTISSYQISTHSDQLEDHETRIKKLESPILH